MPERELDYSVVSELIEKWNRATRRDHPDRQIAARLEEEIKECIREAEVPEGQIEEMWRKLVKKK